MRKVGDQVIYKGEVVTIVEKHKGAITKEPNMHSVYLATGYKRKPCTYTLSNGDRVRGDKIKPYEVQS